MSRKVLVIGATGMLGHKVLQVLAEGGGSGLDIHCSTRRDPRPGEIPPCVTVHDGIELTLGALPLRRLLSDLEPDVIVNAAGMIKQKDLLASVDATFQINGLLPHLLATLNPNRDAKVIHISTDCVYKGTRGGYKETERPDADDVYGRSKAVGEIDYGRHLTLRTSIIGFELSGFWGLLSWLFRQAPGSHLRGFTHALFSGVPTVTLAQEIRAIIETDAPLEGLYQISSQPISKFELLELINDAFRLGHSIEEDSSLKIDRTLDDSRYRAVSNTTRSGWSDLIAALLDDYGSQPYAEAYAALR